MRTNRLSNIGIYISYVFIVIFFLFPILWVLSLSLKSVQEIFANPPVLIPLSPRLENYTYVIETLGIMTYFKNSAIIVAATLIFTLLFAIPAAYGFSRFSFRYKRQSLFLLLVFQMISPIIIAIPLYRFFVSIGWENNLVTLIAVYVALELPFTTWFLKGYLDTIPKELDEAATMDGCTRLQALKNILLPVAGPGIASVSILIAVASWSQFVLPFILLDDKELFPVSMGLVILKNSSESITTHYLAAASMLGILPVIALFMVLQKFIVGALTGGAVKG
jgi:multiple sugar transport system permease protein